MQAYSAIPQPGPLPKPKNTYFLMRKPAAVSLLNSGEDGLFYVFLLTERWDPAYHPFWHKIQSLGHAMQWGDSREGGEE